MKKKKLILLLSFLSGIMQAHKGAITYLDDCHWGGRLGDKLIMYIKAKWVAHHYQLPFLYKPFKYSDQLMMHEKEQSYATVAKTRKFVRTKECQHILDSLDKYINPDIDCLYTIHYYFHLRTWGDFQKKYDSQEIMGWQEVYSDGAFLAQLKEMIAPRKPLVVDHPPQDKVSVAVHIRKGGGGDSPLLSKQVYARRDLSNNEITSAAKTYSDRCYPFKFPPLQYYINQIRRLSEMYDDAEMYVHIYTDDHNPAEIIATIKREVNKPNIVYGCRQKNNNETSNVLEDIFSMAHYDCLIRSGSNYPQISQCIGNHSVVIYPVSCVWVGNTLIIDDVGIFMRNTDTDAADNKGTNHTTFMENMLAKVSTFFQGASCEQKAPYLHLKVSDIEYLKD